MQVLDDHRVAARLVEGRHTHVMVKKALAKGEKLPVAVAIGTHPAVTFERHPRPHGHGVPFAAELMGGRLKVKRCRNGMLVPEAEIVLEGYITAISRRRGRSSTSPGLTIRSGCSTSSNSPGCTQAGLHLPWDPPGGDEHKILMGAPYEPKIYKAVAGVTEVRNVVLTKGGCGYLHAVIQIKKSTQGDAKNAIMAAFAATSRSSTWWW